MARSFSAAPRSMSIDDGSRAEADDDSPNPLEAPFLDDPSAPEPAPEAPWDCGAAYYELIERVGKGAFAEVFAARCSAGARRGTRVGIKVRRQPERIKKRLALLCSIS